MKKGKSNRIFFGVIAFLAIALLLATAVYYSRNSGGVQVQSENTKSSGILYPADSPVVQETDKSKKTTEKIQPSDLDTLNPDTIFIRRQNLMKEYIQATELVAKQSGVPEAREVSSFLRKSVVLMKSNDTLRVRTSDSGGVRSIGFIAILQNEKLSSLNLKKIAEDNRGINYFPLPYNCFVVQDKDLGKTLMNGLLLLHEGSKSRVKDIADYRDDDFFLKEEVKAHQFTAKVLRNLGGISYKTMLESEVERLKVEVDTISYRIWPVCPQYTNEISTLFQAEKSFEKAFIERCFFVDAMFTLLENDKKLSDQERQKKKISFIDNVLFNRIKT
jgi:hypothetical protein